MEVAGIGDSWVGLGVKGAVELPGIGGGGMGVGAALPAGPSPDAPLSTTETSAQFLNCSPTLIGPVCVIEHAPAYEHAPEHQAAAFQPNCSIF